MEGVTLLVPGPRPKGGPRIPGLSGLVLGPGAGVRRIASNLCGGPESLDRTNHPRPKTLDGWRGTRPEAMETLGFFGERSGVPGDRRFTSEGRPRARSRHPKRHGEGGVGVVPVLFTIIFIYDQFFFFGVLFLIWSNVTMRYKNGCES